MSGGTAVTLRQVWFGRVWAAFPMTVVEDTPTRRALYIAPGTVFMAPDCTRAEHLRVLASGKWGLVEMTWNEQPMLWTSVPGEAWSVWTIWQTPGWQHNGWKVNPEAPMRRTRLGFDTADYTLDAIIEPDLERWSLKDEDEFSEAIRLELLTETEAAVIRKETRRVVKSLLTGRRRGYDRMGGLAAAGPLDSAHPSSGLGRCLTADPLTPTRIRTRRLATESSTYPHYWRPGQRKEHVGQAPKRRTEYPLVRSRSDGP